MALLKLTAIALCGISIGFDMAYASVVIGVLQAAAIGMLAFSAIIAFLLK